MLGLKQFLQEGKKRTGYKVMAYQKGKATSGADSRQSFPLKKGKVISFRGDGMFLSLGRDYVIDYYAIHEENVLLTFEFDEADVNTGNLTDRETEFTVSKAKLVDFEVLDE